MHLNYVLAQHYYKYFVKINKKNEKKKKRFYRICLKTSANHMARSESNHLVFWLNEQAH